MTDPIAIERKGLFFKFDDYRDSQTGKGHVIEKSSKNIYNHVSNWRDIDQRLNFTKLFFSQAITAPLIRIPYKLYDLFSGGSIRRGVEYAKREFRILSVETSGKVGRLAYVLLMAKNILICLAKDICKIVTYPLAMIALQFVAILGIASPLDGWVIYSKVESIWRHDNTLNAHKVPACCTDLMFIYSAPCMQSQQSYKQHDLYPLLGNFEEDDPRSLRLFLSRNFEHFGPYFGAATGRLRELTEKLTDKVNEVLKASKSKNSLHGENPRLSKLRSSLQSLITQFNNILNAKDAWIEQLKKNKQGNPQDPTPAMINKMQQHLLILSR